MLRIWTHNHVTVLICVSGVFNLIGLAYSDISSRIIGGSEATIEEAPYMAAVVHHKYYICMGSIISDDFILTSARCIFDSPTVEIQVRVGSAYWKKGGFVYKVIDKFYHPMFQRIYYDFDICILHLSKKLTFGSTVSTIQLSPSPPEPGFFLTVYAWAAVDVEGYFFTEVLKKVGVPIISWETCNSIYETVNVFTRNELCTLSTGEGPYVGSEGSPLVRNNEIAAMVSWSIGKPLIRPTVYMNLHAAEIKEYVQVFMKKERNL